MEKQAKVQGKPEGLVSAFRKYRKEDIAAVAEIGICHPMKDQSKIMTVCHGDLWLNNLMFNADRSTVCIYYYYFTCPQPEQSSISSYRPP